MTRLRKHLRRYWHFHAATLALVGVLAAFLAGAFAGPAIKTVFGVRLDQQGQKLYRAVERTHPEFGQKTLEHEALPPARAAKLRALNNRVAAGAVTPPRPLASPEPAFRTDLVRNYSQRAPGARPVLWVVHDTESPNAPGLQDDYAIVAWFNNPIAQASANYVTDADGNTILMVPTTAKAWHVAFFNSWAIGDELIGHATQTAWPDAQVREAAQLAAHDMTRYGIPIQHGAVSGCTIVRPGIVEHADLGGCGGGHHDPGTNFPISRFIALVHAYATGGNHTGTTPTTTTTTTKSSVVSRTLLRARTGYWSWIAWFAGQAAWKPYGKTNPTVRPNVPRAIARAWWRQAAIHLKGAA